MVSVDRALTALLLSLTTLVLLKRKTILEKSVLYPLKTHGQVLPNIQAPVWAHGQSRSPEGTADIW